MNSQAIYPAKPIRQPVAEGIAERRAGPWARTRRRVGEWRQRIRRRAELRRLLETGHHLVVDTGMGVDEALHEIAKPFYAE